MIDSPIKHKVTKFANLFRLLTFVTLCIALSMTSIAQALAANDSDETTFVDENTEYQSAGVVPAVGSTLKWEITQTVNTRGIDTYNKYKSMQFVDELDSCITFERVEVSGRNNVDITLSAGSVTHDVTTNIVTYSFFDTWLENSMPLEGESYKCTIYGVVNTTPSSNIIKNNAKVLIDNTEMTANETRTAIKNAALSVKHIAKSEIIIPGDGGQSQIAYETTIAQINEGAAVRELNISEDFGAERTFVKNSMVVLNKQGSNINAAITELDNGFNARVNRLDYGQDIVLTYTCNVENAAVGKNISSFVSVSALGLNTITSDPTNTFIVDTKTPRTINITQLVPKNNLLENHGTAFFVYILSGQDYSGRPRQFKQVCVFDPSSTTDTTENATSTCSFTDIPAGTYSLKQVSCLRYSLDSAVDIEADTSVSNREIDLDFMRATTKNLSYTNSKKHWDGQSFSTYSVRN